MKLLFAGGAYHTVAYFAYLGSKGEKALLCLDLLTVLASFGLSIAICKAEDEAASTWEDYDDDENSSAMVSSGLNTVASIAYFTAFFFKSTNPEVSLVGAALMTGTMGGMAALEGIVFKMQYV